MCGLIGFSGPTNKKFNVDKIKTLLFYNQERGKDSLGFYTPTGGLFKETGKPIDIIIKNGFNIPVDNMFIGHVRAATVGVVNKNNAHPFQYGELVLAMNGTLSNHWSLCTEYKLDQKQYDVDTQVLAAIIAKTKTKEVLSKIAGGCALLFTDTKTNTLYAYRNSERPLFRGTIDGCMYLSSIEESLKLIGCSNVKMLKENYLYEIVAGEIPKQYYIAPNNQKIQYDTNLKMNYRYLNLATLPIGQLFGLYLTPDRTDATLGVRFGFGYKCVGQDKGCTQSQMTIINDLGEKVNVFRTTFNYKLPVLTLHDYVFATVTLRYDRDNERFFCMEGELLKIIGISDKGLRCINLLSNAEATISESTIRFGYPPEVAEYKWQHYIKDTENIQNTKLLGDADNEDVKTLTEAEIFKKELDALEMDETYEEHVDFVMDNIEDIVADLEEIKMMAKGKTLVSKLKSVLEFWREGLPKYFDMTPSEEQEEDKIEKE